MLLHALAIENFRNLKQVLLQPHPRFNVLSGDNGQGKTNLLEAIYLLATLRSFRTHRIDEQIRFGAPAAKVRARVERKGIERLLEVELSAGPQASQAKKAALVDGKPARAGDYFGRVNAVLFVPADLHLPGGPPAARRRFLDRAIWNTCPAYLSEVQTYERILRSRNALLRDEIRTASQPGIRDDLLAVYDQQLSSAGAVLLARRSAYLTALSPQVAEAFDRVSQSGLTAVLRYQVAHGLLDSAQRSAAPSMDSAQRSAAPSMDAAKGTERLAEGLTEGLLDRLQRDRRRDRLKGYTHSGPHTDDIEFQLDGRDAAVYASQGQLRAFLLALKIAEIRHLLAVLDEGDAPILLLDDVSSELDAQRNAQLFEFLCQIPCQSFITTTSPTHIRLPAPTPAYPAASPLRRDFRVAHGEIDAMEGEVLQ